MRNNTTVIGIIEIGIAGIDIRSGIARIGTMWIVTIRISITRIDGISHGLGLIQLHYLLPQISSNQQNI